MTIQGLTLLTGGLCLSICLQAQHQSIHFDPAHERTVRISMINSNTTIVGYDGKDILVDGDGALRVVRSDSGVLLQKTNEKAGSYTIKVPHNTNIYYEEQLRNPGKIKVVSVWGAIDVRSWVSSIHLEDVRGPVKAMSQAADISVGYASAHPVGVSSLVSSGRKVDVTLPSGTGADLDLNVMSGTVNSDFNLGTATSLASQPGKPRRIRSSVNGGGALISVQAASIGLHNGEGK